MHRTRELAHASVNQAARAFRFLTRHVPDRREVSLDIPMAKVRRRLPQVLARVEVTRLIDAAPTRRASTLLMTACAGGLGA
ncbi:hypothetical protein [Accumulibacter sp.]|uniref:hypothetical protein n=1 Tax=Accumulibacter sp. TaxID=2053492 RepID=UPI0025E8D526|nr:hypothetical protein [Accumulibacter sp.]MCM8594639.1 hypothetical protein [Accumulibacter sp.]MDS4048785.1 hypothetical protein [Accumulibacter sp.]